MSLRKPLVNRLVKLACVAGWSLFGAAKAYAEFEVSASVQINARADFEVPLAASGSWVEVSGYGHCWRPAHVAVGWEPYCTGYWTWTDCGWYWNSDEPWAWACYHYGNWVFEPAFGWVWVPGIEWAPAWVSWRCGGGYVGWAPLPPPGLFFAHVAAPSLFMFVDVGHFADPIRPSRLIVNNTLIINKTTSINNLRRETREVSGSGSQKVFVNQGPGLDMIQKASHRSFKTVPIREAALRTPVPSSVTHHVANTANRPSAVASHQPQHSWFEHRSPAPTRPADVSPRTPVPDRAPPPARDSVNSRPEHVFGAPRSPGREDWPSREREADRGGDRGSRRERDQGHDHGGGKP